MGELVIDDAASLQRFRSRWLSPSVALAALDRSPVVLLNVPVGVGKSRLLDDVLDELRVNPRFDVVIVLVELTSSLLERRLIQNLPGDVRRLKPRPREDCGPLDPLWRGFEKSSCTAFAKRHLCEGCRHYRDCFWPSQYGKGLKGATVIFGTHAQLRVNPFFVQHIRMVTDAESILLIVDEAGFLQTSYREILDRLKLSRFITALRQANVREDVREQWLYQTTLLTQASTNDLQRTDWKLPNLSPDEIVSIQEAGIAADPRFQWVGYKLQAFHRSRLDRRWSDDRGIHYVVPPYLADRTLILSAEMDKKYVERQLNIDRADNPIPRARIHHKGTRSYNLCFLHGAASRFPGNRPQILDAFAQLILHNIESGRRTLLVSRKHLKKSCITYLTKRFTQWGRVVTFVPCGGEPVPGSNPNIVPVIHYGVSGVNNFEEFDAAYCLNSFYLDQDVLQKAIRDVDEDTLQFPVNIQVQGQPKRRIAGTFDRRFQASDADQVCRTYYRQLETNVVLQAVGRVRYATRPREVITFQASQMPDVPLHGEFYSMREFRQHFGLLTGSEFTRQFHRQEVRRLRQDGLTTRQIGERLGVSERTVRYRLAETKETKV